MEKLAALITKHYKKIFFAFIILSIISGVLLFRLEVTTTLRATSRRCGEHGCLEIMEKSSTRWCRTPESSCPINLGALEAKKKLASIEGLPLFYGWTMSSM